MRSPLFWKSKHQFSRKSGRSKGKWDCIEKSTKIFHKVANFEGVEIKNILWNFVKKQTSFWLNWNFDRKSTVKHDRKGRGWVEIILLGSDKNDSEGGCFRNEKSPKIRALDAKKAWQCIFAMVEYLHIKRTCTSTHVAIEYSTRENRFQQKSAKLVLFTGKMPCRWSIMRCFLFELNKN